MKRLIILLPLMFILSLSLRGQDNYKYYFGINSITSITSSDENVYIGSDSRIITMNRNSLSKTYLTPCSIDYSQEVPPYFSFNYNKILDNLVCIGGQPSHILYEVNNNIPNVKYESNSLTYCNVDSYGNVWVSGSTGYEGFYLKCITSNNILTYRYLADSISNPWPGGYTEYLYADFNCIDFDANNTKWLSTYYGLLKLDSEFTLISCDLPFYSRQFNKIKIDKYDNKWLTTRFNDGLVKYDNESWQIFNVDNSDIPSDSIFELDTDSFGNIWIATSKGLSKYDGNTWITYNMSNSNIEDAYITTLHIDEQNIKWLGTITNKLIKFNDITFETIELGDYPIENNSFLTLHSSEDIVYAAGYSKDILSFNNFELSTHLTYEDKAEGSSFTSLLIENNQTYATFFAFDLEGSGMLSVNEDTSIFYNYQNIPEMNLPPYLVNALFDFLTKDNQGNLWMSNGVGILKFNNDEWTYYNNENLGFPQYALCRGISIDSNDNVVVASGHRISQFINGIWENVNIAAINPFDIDIFSFTMDKHDNYIVGTRENGIFIYDGSDWQNYTKDNSDLPGNEIWCLELDPANNLWAGTDGGLVKYDYSQWTIYSVENSFVPVANVIYDIHIDKNNNIWFVNKAGVTVFNEYGSLRIDSEKKEKNELKVYPNPVKDYVKLEHKESIKDFEIYSTLGVLVTKEPYKGKINVMNLSKGLYLLKITTKSNTIITAKIVKE